VVSANAKTAYVPVTRFPPGHEILQGDAFLTGHLLVIESFSWHLPALNGACAEVLQRSARIDGDPRVSARFRFFYIQ
jgi:hypothetical protein